MTGHGNVKIKEYHPSAWTGKKMSPYFQRDLRTDDGPSVYRSIFRDQVQPNGIDLTVDRVFEQTLGPTFTKDKTFTDPGYLMEQAADDLAGLPDRS